MTTVPSLQYVPARNGTQCAPYANGAHYEWENIPTGILATKLLQNGDPLQVSRIIQFENARSWKITMSTLFSNPVMGTANVLIIIIPLLICIFCMMLPSAITIPGHSRSRDLVVESSLDYSTYAAPVGALTANPVARNDRIIAASAAGSAAVSRKASYIVNENGQSLPGATCWTFASPNTCDEKYARVPSNIASPMGLAGSIQFLGSTCNAKCVASEKPRTLGGSFGGECVCTVAPPILTG